MLLTHEVRLGNRTLLGKSRACFVESIDLGESDWSVQDATNPLTGHAAFGRDVPTRSEVTLVIRSNSKDLREAYEAIRPVQEFWTKEFKPGEYTSLTFDFGGETRTVFGRPRKYAISTDPASVNGVAKFTATFTRMDNLFYADPESLTLTLNGSSSSGLKSPLIAPLTTGAGSGRREGQIYNSSATAPSPFVARFSGPSRNPSLKVGGKTLTVNVSIPWDRTVEVDTRSMTVRWVGGANINSALSQSTRLSQMKIPSGDTEVVYSATDETNLSTCEITWYPARHSL